MCVIHPIICATGESQSLCQKRNGPLAVKIMIACRWVLGQIQSRHNMDKKLSSSATRDRGAKSPKSLPGHQP